MKILKKLKKVIIVAALMCSAMFLVACGGEADYTVTVKDVAGNPVGSDIIVEFYQNEEKVAVAKCDENGVATKTLAKGNYTVKLQFTGDAEEQAYEEVELTSSKREAEITLTNAVGEASAITANGEEYTAYAVMAGDTKVDLVSGMNYFLFTPTQAGEYEFSVNNEEVAIGYYGTPFFVQSESLEKVVDNMFSTSITENMISKEGGGTTVLVIGLNAPDGVESCTLTVERAGDAEATIEDLPWTVYEKTVELKPYTLPAGASLKQFDVTAEEDYKLVLNENDGYYHLNSADGPLVLMYIAVDPPQQYLPCFKTILDRSGLSKYILDENEEVIEKISYSECALEYIEYADQNYGVYPLTEDLKTIMLERGNYVGWWNSESPSFIFKDDNDLPISGLNVDNAWLFMCCYIE